MRTCTCKPSRQRTRLLRIGAALVLALGLLAHGSGHARPRQPAGPQPLPRNAVARLPTLPLRIVVAAEHGKPVVSDPWIRIRVNEARRLMLPHGVDVETVTCGQLDAQFARLETPEDRDSLAAQIAPKVINVFVVARLRDIDKPDRFILGVRWRLRRNVAKDYVILSTKASPTTLAHELGHYLGNGHSPVDNNIMSYDRSDPTAVRFDAAQGLRMRQVGRRLLRTGRLISAPAWRAANRPKR